MKQESKFKLLCFFAAAGAFVFTAPMASAVRASDQAGSPLPGTADTAVVTEPAGAQNEDSGLYMRSRGKFSSTRDMIGTQVIDSSHQPVGQVQNILVDWRSGRASLVVISLQNGNRTVAVPISLFAAQPSQKELVINYDQQKLLAAPTFSMDNLQTPGFIDQTYAYYGQPSPYETPGYVTTYRTVAPYRTRIMGPEVWEPSGAMPRRFVTGHEQDMEANNILHQYQLGKGRAAQLDDYFWNNVLPDDYYAQFPAERPMYRQIGWGYREGFREPAGAQPTANLNRTSDLIGMTVEDSNGKVIGQVKDVVIDWSTGRVAYTVVDPTGVPALNGRYLAIPPRALIRWSSDSHVLSVNIERRQLEAPPTFDPSNWPDPTRSDFMTRVYRFYGQPSWQGGNPSVREPSGSEPQENATPPAPPQPAPSGTQESTPAPTPESQPQQQNQQPASPETTAPQTQTQSDSDLSQRVTSAFQSDSTLAPLASAVIVTAQNGMITLTGTVGTDQEKQQLESKANQIAGNGKVNDQIQVKNGNQ